MEKKDTVPLFCLISLIILTIITSFNPAARVPWLLETAMVGIFASYFIITYKKVRFSNYVYILVTLFLFLPIIGGYYSFDDVPYGELLDFYGAGVNQFDRLVHFIFGLFLTPFIYELFRKTTPLKKGFWFYVMPFMLIMGSGAIYEVVEWSSALVMAPDDVSTWVGTKGDEWDSQKDMMLGGIGSIISSAIYIFFQKIAENKNIKKVKTKIKKKS